MKGTKTLNDINELVRLVNYNYYKKYTFSNFILNVRSNVDIYNRLDKDIIECCEGIEGIEFNCDFIFDKSRFVLLKSYMKQLKCKKVEYFSEEFRFLSIVNNLNIQWSEDYVIIYDKSLNLFYIITDNFSNYKQIVYIIREIIYESNISDDKIIIHSACIDYYENGICILGDSGSGKTTLMLNLIKSFKNISYISNDVLFVDKDLNAKFSMIPVRIACGTLSKYYPKYKTEMPNKKIKYQLKRFLIKFNVSLKYQSNIKIIIIPKFKYGAELKIVKISSKKGQSILNSQNLSIIDNTRKLLWIDLDKKRPSIKEHEDIIGKLSYLPMFEITFGENFSDKCISEFKAFLEEKLK